MALTAKAPPPMPEEEDEDAGASAGVEDMGNLGGEKEGSEDMVLLTVCKEPDGTYSLIKGDEEDAPAEGEEAAAPGAESNKMMFDSVGALLKGILDLLNEDKSSEGAEGSSEDQFAAGFDENAPPKPAAPIPQKF